MFNPDVETCNRGAVCGKTARAVRMEGRRSLPYPVAPLLLGVVLVTVGALERGLDYLYFLWVGWVEGALGGEGAVVIGAG